MLSTVRIYSVKFIILVVALQVLNLSVYGNEYVQTIILKNKLVKVETNQIDSLIEYITEVVLKRENAFPEQKGNHTKNESKNFKVPFQLYSECRIFKEKATDYSRLQRQYCTYANSYDYLFYKEINPPPPKLN